MVFPKPKRRKLQRSNNNGPHTLSLDEDELDFCNSFFKDSNSFFDDRLEYLASKSTKRRTSSQKHVGTLSLIEADEENASVSYLSDCDVGYNDYDDSIICPISVSDDSVSVNSDSISRSTQNYRTTLHTAVSTQEKATRSIDSLCMSKNAVAARENRQKKKNYVQTLEATHKTLSCENEELKKNLELSESEINKLRKEVSYLKGVLANHSSLSSLLKNILNTPGLQFTSSFDAHISNPNLEQYDIKLNNTKQYSSVDVIDNKPAELDCRGKPTNITCNFKDEKQSCPVVGHSKNNGTIKYIELKSEDSGSETSDLSSKVVESHEGTMSDPEQKLFTDDPKFENVNDLKPDNELEKRNLSVRNVDHTKHNPKRVVTPHHFASTDVLAMSTKTPSSKKQGEKRKRVKKPVLRSGRA